MDLIMRRTALLVVMVALVPLGSCMNETARKPSSSVQPSAPADEYFAWEKLPSGHFKQFKKDYFMDKQLCRNVIDVLNDMSTQQPRSNWILSHTTASTFECWPASVNPSDYYKKNSVYGDSPAVTSPVKPDSPGKKPAPN